MQWFGFKENKILSGKGGCKSKHLIDVFFWDWDCSCLKLLADAICILSTFHPSNSKCYTAQLLILISNV